MLSCIFETIAYFRPGGMIMLCIIFSSLWMWALIIERFLSFHTLERHNLNLQTIRKILSGKNDKGLDKYCLEGIQGRLIRKFIKERTGNPELDARIIEQCVLQEHPNLKRRLALITILASAAPLLGLLGTVTGMMTTFDALSFFGTGNPKALAGGISEALVTTQGGLLVAVPGIYMSIYLTIHARRLESRLQETGMTLKRYAEEQAGWPA